jgi:MFS family permease
MSAIVGTEQYIAYFDDPHGIIQGAIGSALAAGSVVGSLMAGPISNKYGRRDSIFFACLWWLIGTAVQVSCKNYGQLIAGRILNGVCVGITSSQYVLRTISSFDSELFLVTLGTVFECSTSPSERP